AADASAPVARRDDEVVDRAASAVVATQDRADQLRSIDGDRAQARIACQEAEQRIATVGFVQADTVAPGPELDGGVEIRGHELSNEDAPHDTLRRRSDGARSRSDRTQATTQPARRSNRLERVDTEE